MPAWINYLIVGIAQLAIAFYLLRHYQERRVSYSLLVLLVVFAIAYDNLAIMLGQFIDAGSLLKSINWVRFLLHALLTPLMIIAIFGIARRVGVSWAQSRTMHIVFCVLAVLFIAFGVGVDLIGITLEPVTDAGVIRYSDPESTPPIPSIVTIVIGIVVGAIVWRKSKWVWLLVGSVVMFVAAGIGFQFPLISNVGEVAFALGMAASEVYANRSSLGAATMRSIGSHAA